MESVSGRERVGRRDIRSPESSIAAGDGGALLWEGREGGRVIGSLTIPGIWLRFLPH